MNKKENDIKDVENDIKNVENDMKDVENKLEIENISNQNINEDDLPPPPPLPIFEVKLDQKSSDQKTEKIEKNKIINNSGRDDLLNSIRKGKSLNKTSEIPKIEKMSATQQNNFANTIAMVFF
jgi:hypothetical protein